MRRTKFFLKKKYNKILNSLMSAEDRIDYTLEKISESIVKLGEARTSIIKLGNSKLYPQQEAIENKIIELRNKFKDFSSKKAEYLAKIKILEVERDLLKSMNGTLYGANIDMDFSDIEDEIRNLEAEIDTLNFFSKC